MRDEELLGIGDEILFPCFRAVIGASSSASDSGAVPARKKNKTAGPVLKSENPTSFDEEVAAEFRRVKLEAASSVVPMDVSQAKRR